jgi:hypothetical protein
MKKLLFLTLLTQISFAQNLKTSEQVQVDPITVMDIKRVIMDGDVYEEQKTTTRKLSNAVDFFPDNIIIPIAPNNPGVLNINQVTLDNMDPKLREFIDNANKSFAERFQLVSNKLVIEATATSERATTDVPTGYTAEQVKVSYKDPSKPNNQDLMEGRANNLKTVLLKFIPELNKLVKAGTVTLNISTKTASQRYVKVVGLEFSKTSNVVKVKNEFNCSDDISVNKGKQGNKSKNWLFMDDKSSEHHTRVIRVNYFKNGSTNTLTKTVEVKFDPRLVPDRYEILTLDKSGQIKNLYKDDYFHATLYAQSADSNKNILKGQFEKSNLTMTAEDIKNIDSIPSLYSKNNHKEIEKFIIPIWGRIFQGQAGFIPPIKRVAKPTPHIIDVQSQAITHILVNVFSPLDGTAFGITVNCK